MAALPLTLRHPNAALACQVRLRPEVAVPPGYAGTNLRKVARYAGKDRGPLQHVMSAPHLISNLLPARSLPSDGNLQSDISLLPDPR